MLRGRHRALFQRPITASKLKKTYRIGLSLLFGAPIMIDFDVKIHGYGWFIDSATILIGTVVYLGFNRSFLGCNRCSSRDFMFFIRPPTFISALRLLEVIWLWLVAYCGKQLSLNNNLIVEYLLKLYVFLIDSL